MPPPQASISALSLISFHDWDICNDMLKRAPEGAYNVTAYFQWRIDHISRVCNGIWSNVLCNNTPTQIIGLFSDHVLASDQMLGVITKPQISDLTTHLFCLSASCQHLRSLASGCQYLGCPRLNSQIEQSSSHMREIPTYLPTLLLIAHTITAHIAVCTMSNWCESIIIWSLPGIS